MDYADEGDLLMKVKEKKDKGVKFDEKEVWNIVIQMVKGIKALHDKSILHRDLKSANVFMYSDGTVKIGDLNVSKIMREKLSYTQTGTPYYASPEIWRDKPYDFKSDIWSLGVIFYEICQLSVPFKADNIDDLFKKVCRGVY
jgi:NIMA (never in mitosis gene a)-related kinase